VSASIVLRREVLYRGHVQGVGFRYSTRSIAARYAVTGFVKNLADGRVQLVVEGSAVEVDALLDEIARSMSDHIHEVQQRRDAATGAFDRFEIAY